MDQTMKLVIKFNFTNRDILLYNHYTKKLNELSEKLGSKISVGHGAMHRGYYRNRKRKWEEVIIYDIVIVYPKDYERPVLKAVV